MKSAKNSSKSKTPAKTAPTKAVRATAPGTKTPKVLPTPALPVPQDTQSEQATGSRKRWLGLGVLSLALMIVILDNTVLNIALPTIVKEFDSSLSDLQWVISGYSLVVASLLITFGRLGDLFGRRRLFVIGALVFGIGSYLASISYSALDLFIGESVIEGLGAAMMLPATLSLISSTFRGKERGMAFAVWGGIAGAAGAFGPLLGGWLTSEYSWRWAFLLNVFIAPLAIIGAYLFLQESKEESSQRFDFIGVISVSLGLFGLVFSLIEGDRFGWWQVKEQLTLLNWQWPWEISVIPVIALLSIGLLTFFGWWEHRQEQRGAQPLFEPSLLRWPGFRYGLLTTLILSLGEFGIVFVLPIYFQVARHYSAIQTGLALLPLGIAAIVGSFIAGASSRRISPSWLIIVGMVLEAIGIFIQAFSFSAATTELTLYLGLAIYGLGVGLATTQLTSVVLSDIPVAKSGVASGVNGTVRQVGTALGIAIIGTILTTHIATNFKSAIEATNQVPTVVKQVVKNQSGFQQPATAASPNGQSLPSQVSQAIESITSQAVATASKDAALFAGITVFLGALLSLLIPRSSMHKQ